MDVKTAFLHGELEETIYMDQPYGFEASKQGNKVCLLKRSLYGLKQSPRQWYKRFDSHMLSIGFNRSKYDSCVYFKKVSKSEIVYLLLYVDDMLIACKSMIEINKLKDLLSKEFDMKDLGNAKRILGMDIIRERKENKLYLSQHEYITKLVKKLNMQESREVQVPFAKHFKLSSDDSPKTPSEVESMVNIPYSSTVGSLMYAMVCTRPDLAHPLSVVSRFLANPGEQHWKAVKWILRYLACHTTLCLCYSRDKLNESIDIMGYVDADYATDIDKRRSLTGFVFKLFNCTICWKSNLQSIVALSTTESEYIALTEAVKEAIWLKGIVSELCCREDINVIVNCDSQSAIHLSKNHSHHERTKHIDVRYHFVRDVINEGLVQVKKVSTDLNAADMFTKALPFDKFNLCMSLMNMSAN